MGYQLRDYRSLAASAIGSYYSQPPRYSQLSQGQQQRSYMGTRRMPTFNKKRKYGNFKTFRTQMLNNTPAKHDTNAPTQALAHNILYTMNITEAIVQGDTNQDRDGDAINLEALKIRASYRSSAASGAYSFRIIVGWSGEEVATAATFTAVGLSTGQVFLPGSPAVYLSIVNPKAFTVLYDETIDVNSQIAAVEDVQSLAKTILLKTKFNYQSTGSTFGKTRNLYILAMGNLVGGVNAGQIDMHTDCIFK